MLNKFLLLLMFIFGFLSLNGVSPMEAPDDMRLNEWAYLCSHNSFSTNNAEIGKGYPHYAQQNNSIADQLEKDGVRALMYDIWPFSPQALADAFKSRLTGLLDQAKDLLGI